MDYRVEKIAHAAGITDYNNSKKQDSLLYTACLSKLNGDARKIADAIDFSWTTLSDVIHIIRIRGDETTTTVNAIREKSKITCQICKKTGHSADKCWCRKNDNSQP
eukprot:TRINITY_DN8707_c0_g1_i2.p1 TRINITY_DN8707_c0_g1~~TRINITY_DN8707_c0_g1_i2.p1  ORF type:complete len:106 (-),score=8.39 TRINITY_DN8707_c0_g1_i2:180-497(-)